MHRLLLFRADLAFDPQEFPLAGEILEKVFFVEIREDLGQTFGRGRWVDHQRGLGIEGMRFDIRGQNTPMAIHDIGPLCGDGRPLGRSDGFHRFRGGQNPHPRPDHGKRAEEKHAQHQKPPLGTNTRAVLHILVAAADVFTLDAIGVLALVTQTIEIDFGQFAQPIGPVQIGPFGAQHIEPGLRVANLGLDRAGVFENLLCRVILAVGPKGQTKDQKGC